MVTEDRRSQDDPAYWCALLRAPVCTNPTLPQLLERFGLPGAIFEAEERALRQMGMSASSLAYFRNPDWKGVERDLRWLARARRHLVSVRDHRYPGLLKRISDPPAALFLQGDPAVLASAQLAIVGSRSPTSGGRRNAHEFAFGLARLGLTITSGLAVGIDSCAHQGALDANGRTVAVLGSGPDFMYPRENSRLADTIVESGAVISEFPTGYVPLAANFPRRNRIISGMSVGTLVVEAAKRSGSLITARLALEQGREVFAVPGSIHNPTAGGCHELIRHGATLVERLEDITREISQLVAVALEDSRQPSASPLGLPEGLDGNCKVLLDNIGYEPVHVDSLIESASLSPGIAASILSHLEIAGLIESLPGGNFIRR